MEGQRDGDRDDCHRDGANGQAAQDRLRDDQHSHHRQCERGSAEHDRTRRGARDGQDGGPGIRTAGPFFAQPRDDEQRVVDAQRQPHRDEHVRHEQVELEQVSDDRDQPQPDDDRDHRH
jgi:hypothetical protein